MESQRFCRPISHPTNRTSHSLDFSDDRFHDMLATVGHIFILMLMAVASTRIPCLFLDIWQLEQLSHVQEFEKLPKCGQLKLQHFLLKPVQRLPQYRMLLEDYLRHLPPSSSDFDDTTNALRIVSEAAEHANDTVKQGVRNTVWSMPKLIPVGCLVVRSQKLL